MDIDMGTTAPAADVVFGNGSLTTTPTPNMVYDSNNTSGGETVNMGPLLYQYVYVTLLNAVVFLVGVLGNILVIQVVVRTRSMWKRMNFFLISLSVADLQLLIVGLPVAVLEFYSKERWYIGDAMCRLVPFLENASHHCSVMTLLVIGFERYYAICHPLQETSRSRITSPGLLIPATWILSCVVSLPMAFSSRILDVTFYDGSEVEICRIDVQSQLLRAYILFIFSVFLVLPLLLLTSMYSIIILTLENSVRNNSSMSNGDHTSLSSSERRTFRKDNDNNNMRMIKSRRQVIRMMVAVMALYFLCLLPMRVVQIWNVVASQEDLDSLGLEGTINLMYSVRMLIYLNCAGNPIIYGLISSNFRNAFKQSMSCKSGTLDGYRYNVTYYNNHQRRSANFHDQHRTSSEMNYNRGGYFANKHATNYDNPGAGREKYVSNTKRNVRPVIENDKNSVMTDLGQSLNEQVCANSHRNCSNGNQGTFV